MRTYVLALSGEEIIHLLRAETDTAHGAPELDIGAPEKEYLIEEDFDRAAYGLRGGEQFDLVTSVTTLTIEPRVESGYWILETTVERSLGPILKSQEDQYVRETMSLDEFEVELRSPGPKRTDVHLHVQTAEARQDFDRWLADMRTRHPWKRAIGQRGAAMRQEAAEGNGRIKEAVAVFGDPGKLEAAVDELEISGFDRAAISVLATDAKASEQVERFYRSIKEVEDSGTAPRSAFVSRDSQAEGEAALFGIPLYIGGMAGAAAVVATGGALAAAIAALIVGGVTGGSLGAILAIAMAHHHSVRVHEQLDKGGFVLWVSVLDSAAEKRAMTVLTRMGARDVHVHEITPMPSATSLYLPQVDPFLLEKDRA
jgi:outer membrane lipoprotein SlyB